MDDFPLINTSFDFRVDSSGRDPDKYSPTLRRYHQLLWSKPLPSGEVFTLEPGGGYLLHESDLGYFPLSSDSVTPTFTKYKRMAHLVDQFRAGDNEAFVALASTVGGVLVFPSTIIDGKQTINGARGFTRKIADRIDLTLECIRRHYTGAPSPLSDVLDRYADFFALFDDFDGYVEFFLLHDLIDEGGHVRFFMPFDDFNSPAIPGELEPYMQFREATTDFLHARNRRIDAWTGQHLGTPSPTATTATDMPAQVTGYPGARASIEKVLDFALSYNGYQRLGNDPESLGWVVAPIIDAIDAGREIPEWAGLDLLRGALFYLARRTHLTESMEFDEPHMRRLIRLIEQRAEGRPPPSDRDW